MLVILTYVNELRMEAIAVNPIKPKLTLSTVFTTNFLGWMAFWAYLIWWIVPAVMLPTARIVASAIALTWCFIAYVSGQAKLKLNIVIVFALLFQTWSIVTAIIASYTAARPLGLGRSDLFWLEYLLPFLTANALLYVDPDAKRKMIKGIVLVFGVSSFVAWMQFFKIPPGSAIAKVYTYKDIDFWDGTVGLRAVGLTFHPGILAAQSLFAFALLLPSLYSTTIKRSTLLLLFFFSGSVVFSQARTMLPVLFAAWLIALVILVRHHAKLVAALIVVGSILLFVAMLFGQNRLGYMLQSSSVEEDPSYQFRANVIWSQLDPIARDFPVTGIGPSPGLFLGTGPEDKWVTQGRVMESAYRLFMALYGLVGLALLLIAYSLLLLLSLKNFYASIKSRTFKLASASIVLVLTVATASYTGNTFDNFFVIPFCFLMSSVVKFDSIESQPNALAGTNTCS